MTDIYSWILSPEVREHLRKTYPLSTLDKARLICGAFRSIEEKETALRALLEEVEPGEDRERLTKLVRLYGLALEELRTTGPEALFVLPACRSRPDKTNPLLSCEAGLYASYEELLEEAEVIGKGPQCASKRKRVDGRWQVAIGFDVHQVNGVYCATRFWHIDGWLGVDGIVEETMDIQAGYDEYYPEQILYPIPFMTGDLVKLDAPMFDEPLYGVMDNVVDLNGTPYRWLGYVDGDHLNVMPLSGNLLDFDSGYRVVDWLHSAKPEELPEGEEILWKISQHLTSQPRREVPGFDLDSEFLDIFSVQNQWKFRRWKEIPFSELLAQVREAGRGHG